MKSINFELVKSTVVNLEPPKNVYKCRSGSREEGVYGRHKANSDPVMLHTEHPPLFGYRYYYDATDASPEPVPRMLSSQHCLNDIVLLRFNSPNPQSVQDHLNNLNNCRCRKIVSIRTINKLQKYNRPRDKVIEIAVKNFTGRIVNNTRTVDEQRRDGVAHDILFKLEDGYVK